MSDTTIIEIVELTMKEIELIKAIRHRWRFGELTLLVRDGQPYRMKRVTEFTDLSEGK